MDAEHISGELDLVLEALEKLHFEPVFTDQSDPVRDKIPDIHLDTRFLKLFLLCLRQYEESIGEDAKMRYFMTKIQVALENESGQSSSPDVEIQTHHTLIENIENLKPEVKEVCEVFWDITDGPFMVGSTSSDVTKFIGLILWSMRDFLNSKADHIAASVKNHIGEELEELCFYGNAVYLTADTCTDQEKLGLFIMCMHHIVVRQACLCVIYWIDVDHGYHLATKSDDKVFPLEFVQLFIEVLTASRTFEYHKLMIGNVVAGFVDWIQPDLLSPVKDQIAVVCQGLVFLIAFLMSPPENFEREAGNALWAEIHAVINQVSSIISSIYTVENDEDISLEKKICLSSLEQKIEMVKAEVREFVQITSLSKSCFPTTNGVGFIDFLSEHLKQMLKCTASRIPFAKDKVETILEELQSLRHTIKDIMELSNEHKEIEVLQKRIINVAYKAEHAVNSCLVLENPIWYDTICLSDVIEEIKVIKYEIRDINDQQMYKARKPGFRNDSTLILPGEANSSRMEEVVVGFKDVSEAIIDRLIRGSEHLDIVSIVGMPGQGKTTLANKVFNHPSVRYYFNRCAWCSVSQSYSTKDLLLDILRQVNVLDVPNAREDVPNATEKDLAEWLWKSLRRQRFLIVMDDIWDIGAWYGIKGSLPDDENGSRVVFTSRIHNLLLQAKPNGNPYPLPPLSDEESFELLQEKLFSKNGCPSDFLEAGKNIARKCNGLPLAVVLVAGILARDISDLDCWKQVQESMESQIGSEGCMDILELSYNRLPHCLRPCFLYFGAFPKGKHVRVRKLMKLWSAEGFVISDEVKSSNSVAGEYLMDLMNQSLISIADRSSSGAVKAYRIHDLLHDFCLAKARDERFLLRVHGYDVSSQSLEPEVFNEYRLCIDGNWEKLITSAGPGVHSLLDFGNHPRSWMLYATTTSLFLGLKFLIVLDLEWVYLEESFPDEIVLMVHLRFLALWCSTNYIPPHISYLWNLETLILKTARNIHLPDIIWKMKSLRHIYIPTISVREYENDDTCQLQNLETFSAPILCSGKHTEEILRRLPRVRKLKCYFLEIRFRSDDRIQNPITFPDLSSLSQLESLNVCNAGDMLTGENGDQFPSFSLPNTLRKLTLETFCLARDAMSALGQLPNLEVLKLRKSGFWDLKWDMEDGEFTKLKFLQLYKVQVEKWNDCSEPFPCLEQLDLINCEDLEEIPSSFGDILTFKMMKVYRCNKATSSALQIFEQQKDMGNDGLEVYIIEA